MSTKRVRSTTSLSTFLTCRRKYELRTVQRLRPIHPPTWSRFGRAFHRFDEAYHAGEPVETALRLARPTFFGDAPEEVPIDQWDGFVILCTQYADTYPILSDRDPKRCLFTRETKTGLVFRPELQEAPFKVPIFTPKGRCSSHAEYSGVFDAIVEDADGALWVFETKTVAMLTEAFFDKLAIDRQALRYVYAARQIFGPRVKGLIYNAVSKTAPRRPAVRQDGWMSTAAVVTSPELLEVTVAECREAFLAKVPGTTLFGLIERGDLGLAAAYVAHHLGDEAAPLWPMLEARVAAKTGTDAEKALKLLAKGRQDHEKYLQLYEASKSRLFYSRKVRTVSNEELEEIQWELYQLDRDVYLAEKEGHFYPNERSCDALGGCEYRPWCLRGDAQSFHVVEATHAELPDNGFLTPANPRPVKSHLTELTELLSDDESTGAE